MFSIIVMLLKLADKSPNEGLDSKSKNSWSLSLAIILFLQLAPAPIKPLKYASDVNFVNHNFHSRSPNSKQYGSLSKFKSYKQFLKDETIY